MCAAPPLLSAGLLTDVGRQRRVNQDAVLALDLPQGGLYAVADGMGGHAAGELAANLALDALSQHYLEGRGSPPERLAEAVQAANLAVLQHAVGEYVGMGTTLLALLIDRGAALLAHVGDSRAYLLRAGKLQRLTEDHSWVAEQVRLGNLTEAEARNHHWRSVISNGLGAEKNVRLELFGLPLRAGDRLLLCSDGLSGVVGESTLLELLARSLPPERTVRELINAANEAGGPDNITAVVVDILRDQRLPHYPLPVRRSDGPMDVQTLLRAQRRSRPLTYVLLILAYFTLLGVMLIPEHRTLVALLGTLLLIGVTITQRLARARLHRSAPHRRPDRAASPPDRDPRETPG